MRVLCHPADQRHTNGRQWRRRQNTCGAVGSGDRSADWRDHLIKTVASRLHLSWSHRDSKLPVGEALICNARSRSANWFENCPARIVPFLLAPAYGRRYPQAMWLVVSVGEIPREMFKNCGSSQRAGDNVALFSFLSPSAHTLPCTTLSRVPAHSLHPFPLSPFQILQLGFPAVMRIAV